MRATAAPLASSASTSLASSRGSLGSARARGSSSRVRPRLRFAPRAPPRVLPARVPPPRHRLPGSSRRSRRGHPGGAPLEIDDGADVDAPVATPGVSTKRPDDDDVPKPPLRVAAALAAAGCVESSYLAFEKIVGGDVACPSPDARPRSPPATPSSSACPSPPTAPPPTASSPPSRGGAPACATRWTPAADGSASASADAYARARLLVFLAGAGLAGVSSYLLYVLAVPLGGAECVYRLTSAAISFTVAAIGFSGLSARETGRVAPAAIALYAVTVLGLSLVLVPGDDVAANAKDFVLPYNPPTIEAKSTAYSRDLAEFLKRKGAKMSRAFGARTARIRRRRSARARTFRTWSVSRTDGGGGRPSRRRARGRTSRGFPRGSSTTGQGSRGRRASRNSPRRSGSKRRRRADAAAQLDAFLGQ